MAKGGAAARSAGTAPALAGGIAKIWLDGRVEADLADSAAADRRARRPGRPGDDGTGVDGRRAGHRRRRRRTPTSPTASTTSAQLRARRGRRRPQRPRHARRLHRRRHRRRLRRLGQGRRPRRRPASSARCSTTTASARTPGSSTAWSGRPRPARRRRQHEPRRPQPERRHRPDARRRVNDLTRRDRRALRRRRGQRGTASSPIGAPGAADAALTVGAVDGADQRAVLLQHGPAHRRPRAQARHLRARRRHHSPPARRTRRGEGLYVADERHVDGDPARRGRGGDPRGERTRTGPAQRSRTRSCRRPRRIAGTPYEVGTGRLDVLTAIDDIDATGSAFLGFYGWPHDGDPVGDAHDHLPQRGRRPGRR